MCHSPYAIFSFTMHTNILQKWTHWSFFQIHFSTSFGFGLLCEVKNNGNKICKRDFFSFFLHGGIPSDFLNFEKFIVYAQHLWLFMQLFQTFPCFLTFMNSFMNYSNFNGKFMDLGAAFLFVIEKVCDGLYKKIQFTKTQYNIWMHRI